MGGAPSQEEARTAYARAFTSARADDDVEAMADAALGLASLQRFGGEPGRGPALLHEAYLAAADMPETRARLASALARSWVYGNDAERGRPFAEEAVALADQAGDAPVLADALDAQLATTWGPDDLAERLHITSRLQDVAAHVDDVRTRLDAHLWRLTTALETLDVVGVQRQLSALDRLAEETDLPVPRFFALTRRAMYAVLTDDLDGARSLIAEAGPIGYAAGIPDTYAVTHTLLGECVRHSNDATQLRAEATLYEEHAVAHGIQSLLAEAAVLWVEAGEPERGARLVTQIAGRGFDVVARDVDWMLTVTKCVDAAARAGVPDIARDGLNQLAPYAGRAVVDAGAVVCQGVVEDYLHAAALAVGDERAEDWRAAAIAAYQRLGASWWLRRVQARDARSPARSSPGAPLTLAFRALPGQGMWSIGAAGAEQLLADMKGLRYLHLLLERPGVDVSALDLSAMAAGQGGTVDEAPAGELLDRRALSDYRRRLSELDEELDEAQSWADTGRVERIETERDALLREIAGATGIGGRVRSSGGSAERARVAVRKAMTAALERIEAGDPFTARVLRRCVTTGSRCRYTPDPDTPTDWQL